MGNGLTRQCGTKRSNDAPGTGGSGASRAS